MSETIVGTEAVEAPVVESTAEAVSDERLVAMLVDRARNDGLQLTGEGGLLQQLTKRVLESALEGEITDHVGYDKHDAAGRNSGNSRNGNPFEDRADRRRPGRGEGAPRCDRHVRAADRQEAAASPDRR